jgi:hypothetical protein
MQEKLEKHLIRNDYCNVFVLLGNVVHKLLEKSSLSV